MELMMIAGAILVAIGLYLILFYPGQKGKGADALKLLMTALILLVAGGWMILHYIPRELIIRKLSGLVLAGFGSFLIVFLPDKMNYQEDGFVKLMILVGMALGIVGVYWLLF